MDAPHRTGRRCSARRTAAPSPGGGRRPSSAGEWSPWFAPLALIAGLVVATVGSLIVDLPAAAFGVDVNGQTPAAGTGDRRHRRAGRRLRRRGDLLRAGRRSRRPRRGMFGLRPTRLWRAVRLGVLTLVGFLLFSADLDDRSSTPRKRSCSNSSAPTERRPAGAERRLDLRRRADLRGVPVPRLHLHCAAQLEGLYPAAILTGCCSVASMPARRRRSTSSRSACSASACACSIAPPARSIRVSPPTALNNSLAFGSLENWGWQIPVLMASSLLVLGLLALALTRAGLAERVPAPSG